LQGCKGFCRSAKGLILNIVGISLSYNWHGKCIYVFTKNERRNEMKHDIARKASYLGAGIGLVLFAIFGLLPGSIVGGAMGLGIVGAIFGTPVTSSILPRLIVGSTMLTGVMASGVLFVAGCSLFAWLLGSPVDMLRASGHGNKGLILHHK
jgi:hypothetical protein